MNEWNAITKKRRWNSDTSTQYVVECTDGTLKASHSSMCGDSAEYKLDNEILYITGTGTLDSYMNGGCPWEKEHSVIREVYIERGITNIGDFEFAECAEEMNIIHIPKTVTTIGWNAFQGVGTEQLTICYEGSESDWNNISKEETWDEVFDWDSWGYSTLSYNILFEQYE